MTQYNLEPRANNNPAFNPDLFRDAIAVTNDDVMTVSGTINKTGICLALLVLAAAFIWNLLAQGYADMVNLYTGISFGVTFILGLIIIFRRFSPSIKYLVPIYALTEGVLLGNISFMFEKLYSGIIYTAIEATLLCLFVMLGLYKFGVIKVTDKLRSTIFLATLTIAGIYLIDIILMFFGIRVPVINSVSISGILFSFFVVVLASFNLLLDFDFIERASRGFLPKHIEWYGAFGLMVSLVWLYIEMLKLLAKLQRRN